MARQFTPIAIRLSRFFEVGAYVAVAAAIVVALFLGVRLLERRSIDMPVTSQVAQPSVSVPSVSVPGVSVPSVVAGNSESQPQLPAVPRSKVNPSPTRHVQSASKSLADTTEPSQASTDADADYVALMFCDPLSCSSDAQVVRMELPSPGMAASGGEQDAQMRIADVVVGYDGVVRAVRIVN
jgi:hypothetical protein